MYINGTISPFQYLGGKYSCLPWLLPLLPQTKSFVDVFGGSATVILNKEPSQINTYNDINGIVVNFFQELRNNPEELIKLIELTPHSRYEYENAWITSEIQSIVSNAELARRFFVRTRQSFMATGAQKNKKGWLSATKETRVGMSEATSKWLNSIEMLQMVVERLKQIQVENRGYQYIFKHYDTPESLLYCDPPYDDELRSSGNDYAHDFTEADHLELHSLASHAKGLVAVSGYNSEFMMDLYSNFQLTMGPERKNNYSKRKAAHECLWTNYDPAKAVMGQLNIFEQ